MIPFFQIEYPTVQSVLEPRERRLAREMGHPPWEVRSIPAAQSARRLAESMENDLVGLVFHPEFAYDPISWRRWITALLGDGAAGMINVPLGNQDPLWQKGLHVPIYLTRRGLETASRFKGPTRWMIRSAGRPESYDVAVAPVSLLTGLPAALPIGDLSTYWFQNRQKVRIFCRGWLHAFNAVKDAGRRHDLISMCPWHGRVLEIGCGIGLMAETCRNMGFDVGWVGVDINRDVLIQARSASELVIQADINAPLPFAPNVRFDRIVCGDVLEHLPYPWEFLSRLRGRVKPDGLLIASFPNVGHWSVIEDLLDGRWDETPSGLFCINHLRFGTQTSWRRWFEKTGWETVVWQEETVPLPDPWLISRTDNRDCDRNYNWNSLETIRYRVAARPTA